MNRHLMPCDEYGNAELMPAGYMHDTYSPFCQCRPRIFVDSQTGDMVVQHRHVSDLAADGW